MQLESMYQEIILDHYKNPHGRGLREPFEAEVHHVNPTCGDEVTLRLHLEGDDRSPTSPTRAWAARSARPRSRRCTTSSSARACTEALAAGEDFMTLMQAKGDPTVAEKLEDSLEDAVAFAGVSKYPARIKCALMSWMALKDASARALATTMPTAPRRNAMTADSSTENATPATDGAPGDLPAYKTALLEDVEEAMRDVVDPELGVNVVDLGPRLRPGRRPRRVEVAIIDMTLTSAACPLTDVIEDQARQALTGGPGPGLVDDIRINWVWMPPWGPDKITDDGREQLRALGFRV